MKDLKAALDNMQRITNDILPKGVDSKLFKARQLTEEEELYSNY
jgi:hypothetical protein